MESIQESLKKMPQSETFNKQYRELRQRIFSDKGVAGFFEKHPEITEDMVKRSLAKLYEYTNQSHSCDGCDSLSACKNMMQGYEPHLFINGNSIDLEYKRCPSKLKDDEKKSKERLIQSYYIPKDILSATFSTLDTDPTRMEAIQYAVDFVESFEPGKTFKGIYLYGDFGVGKTYLMGAIANQLAEEKGVKSLFVYTPDFFREMKSAIQTQSIDEKLDFIRSVPLLILDDIGSENISGWIRDDILGSILQYRMMERLPTLYTSNYDFNELEEHLAYSQKGGIEEMKAKRIMERIRHFADPIYLGGKNRRV
ncbi:primosomal protein DnaI [Pseudalkalibacillus caeni]|uniref:Primosomal protein DnaI n=1 Tax=Exobacillus caeni TaxID=2574798 RepID=A0A5R9FAC9_9BACL|nr:primosomal protein DnaI [Pseudalkalibacillus caeni]TLS39156.1 primosomal protein DnaI [Pseudalkalibacillus caeni]